MHLILVRHAEAVDLQAGIPTDAARPLTVHGRVQSTGLANALAAMRVPVDGIACSPLVRAEQTAEILRDRLVPGQSLFITDRLALESLRPKKLSADLAAMPAETLIAVGHMPDLAAYAAWLLGMKPNAIEFQKSAAMAIDLPEEEAWKGAGRLLWLVPPVWWLDPETDTAT
ncbi:MAG: SixA phosphatase family protein [Gemmataceae bacterium]